MRVKLVLCSLGLAVCLLQASALPLAAADSGNPAPAVEVRIDNFSFAPASVRIAAGATVTWVNHDDIPHTVVSTDRVFKSHALDTGDKFSYTFAKPGRYPYFCGMHPKMTGEVIVQ